jgi:hypothetical protein
VTPPLVTPLPVMPLPVMLLPVTPLPVSRVGVMVVRPRLPVLGVRLFGWGSPGGPVAGRPGIRRRRPVSGPARFRCSALPVRRRAR